MGVIVSGRQAVHPADTRALEASPAREFYYASEVVPLLGVERIDYHQLRVLLRIVRRADDQPEDSRWLRFSLADVASLRIAIDLVGGTDAFSPGRRIRLSPLRDAVKALHDLGIQHPLIEVPLAIHGGRVIAQIQGQLVDPTSGQSVLGTVFDLMRDALPASSNRSDALQRLASERATLRRPAKARAIIDADVRSARSTW